MNIKSLIKRNFEKQPVANHSDYKSSILRAPKNNKINFPSTVSEISGPSFNKDIIRELAVSYTHLTLPTTPYV